MRPFVTHSGASRMITASDLLLPAPCSASLSGASGQWFALDTRSADSSSLLHELRSAPSTGPCSGDDSVAMALQLLGGSIISSILSSHGANDDDDDDGDGDAAAGGRPSRSCGYFSLSSGSNSRPAAPGRGPGSPAAQPAQPDTQPDRLTAPKRTSGLTDSKSPAASPRPPNAPARLRPRVLLLHASDLAHLAFELPC